MDNKLMALVVDDEQDFRHLMVTWLESKGYSVAAVSDGRSAVNFVRENDPDVVFLDLNMPVMDGVETLKEIRVINKNIPVIISSAYFDARRSKEVNVYGISGIFFKHEDFNKGLLCILKKISS